MEVDETYLRVLSIGIFEETGLKIEAVRVEDGEVLATTELTDEGTWGKEKGTEIEGGVAEFRRADYSLTNVLNKLHLIMNRKRKPIPQPIPTQIKSLLSRSPPTNIQVTTKVSECECLSGVKNNTESSSS